MNQSPMEGELWVVGAWGPQALGNSFQLGRKAQGHERDLSGLLAKS